MAGLRAALVAVMLGTAGEALAQQSTGFRFLDDLGKATAPEQQVIQNRKYQLLNEFQLLAGGFPVDPYYKGVAGTVGYGLHFTDFVAVEGQFSYAYNMASKLKKELETITTSLGNDPPDFSRITWMAGGYLVVKPIYGKQALFNTQVLHMEGYARLGGAALQRTKTSGNSLNLGVDFGLGMRLWVGEITSLRIDLGELVYFPGVAPKQALHLHLGLAWNLRAEDWE